jgi:hypothetical protein
MDMLQPFDILRLGKDDIPVWVEAVGSFDAANARVKELLKLHPTAEYWIFNQQTQTKVAVKSGVCLSS